jgi:hypothetical protein
MFRFQRKSQPVVAAFDMAHASSDGGAVLLKAIDRRLGLTERLATCVTEWREPGKVQHSILELLRQRVFGPAGISICPRLAKWNSGKLPLFSSFGIIQCKLQPYSISGPDGPRGLAET